MRCRYVTADVFTSQPFLGNPVAVVLDAGLLSSGQMQAIAHEFAYSETTFVLPPQDERNDALIRIFTPWEELPFAGHPTIGTAFVLARAAVARGLHFKETMVLEELSGCVSVSLMHEDEAVIGAWLTAPEPLSCGAAMPLGAAAACLSLGADAVSVDVHQPLVASVGVPYLILELVSRRALRRCKPDPASLARVLPVDGATSIYAYTRDVDPDQCDIDARMFTSRMIEDPATGGAAAATGALIASLTGSQTLSLRVQQGLDVSRKSQILTRTNCSAGATRAAIGGRCVEVMSGTIAF